MNAEELKQHEEAMAPLRASLAGKPNLTLWHNDCDWVVAESPEDATRVYAEYVGGGTPADYADLEWEPWGEDRPLSITIEQGGGEPDKKITLTGAEWAAKGRAYLGSTEF